MGGTWDGRTKLFVLIVKAQLSWHKWKQPQARLEEQVLGSFSAGTRRWANGTMYQPKNAKLAGPAQ